MATDQFNPAEWSEEELDEMLTDDCDYDDSVFIPELDEAMLKRFAATEWATRLQAFTDDTPWGERIALYQAMRDANALTPEVSFFLLSWAIEGNAQQQIAELGEHGKFEERLRKIYLQHGMEPDDAWDPGEEPQELMDLEEEYSLGIDKIIDAEYQRAGETAMAELITTKPEEAERLSNAGEIAVFDMIEEELP